MKTVIHHGNPSLNKAGNVGSHVELQLHAEVEGEWSGIYKLASHGMTPEEFMARVSELKAYHAAKMKRLNGFRDLKTRDVVVDGGAKYRIMDVNILERGNDVELRLGVYEIGPLGHQRLAFKMGAKDGLLYPSIDAVPADVVIEVTVRMRIAELALHAATHATFVRLLATGLPDEQAVEAVT